MIAVVDYHKGNLKSVERGIAAAGGDARITDDAALIARAEAVVLPGVGAFADAAATMQATGQMDAVRERIAASVPFLGICLGMHLMFEEGVEGAPEADDEESSHNAQGLSILPGAVCPLPRTDETGQAYKIPHVGWNTVVPAAQVAWTRPHFAGIQAGANIEITHSYIAPTGPFAIAQTTHSATFPCAVQYGDVTFGVQFHPEKSSDAGMRLLRNFVNIVKGA